MFFFNSFQLYKRRENIEKELDYDRIYAMGMLKLLLLKR